MFIAVLFVIPPIQTKPLCPLLSEWFNKLWYIDSYHKILVSKQKEQMTIHIWMNLQRIIMSEKT